MNTNAPSLQRQPEGSLPQVTWDSNRDSNGPRMAADLVHKREVNTNAPSLLRQPEGSLPQVTWDSNRDSNGLRMASDLVHKMWNLNVRLSNISISGVHNNSHLIYISSEGCWFDPIIYTLWFSTFCTWFAQNIKKSFMLYSIWKYIRDEWNL